MADFCLGCGEYVGQNKENSPYCKCDRDYIKSLEGKIEQTKEATIKLIGFDTYTKNEALSEIYSLLTKSRTSSTERNETHG